MIQHLKSSEKILHLKKKGLFFMLSIFLYNARDGGWEGDIGGEQLITTF